MNAMERLKRDHAILRAKLNVLESAMAMGAETWFVLREICYTLARQLQDHIRREEALMLACRHALTEEAITHLTVEHRDEPQHLEAVNRLFLCSHERTVAELRPALTDIINGLRRHMDEEERELFPVMERILASREAAPTPASSSSRISELMTVNRVVHEHPETRRVFDRLFVNVPIEGCDCLDEVAWRHGLESRELLDKLDRVMSKGSDDSSTASDRACACAS